MQSLSDGFRRANCRARARSHTISRASTSRSPAEAEHQPRGREGSPGRVGWDRFEPEEPATALVPMRTAARRRLSFIAQARERIRAPRRTVSDLLEKKTPRTRCRRDGDRAREPIRRREQVIRAGSGFPDALWSSSTAILVASMPVASRLASRREACGVGRAVLLIGIVHVTNGGPVAKTRRGGQTCTRPATSMHASFAWC